MSADAPAWVEVVVAVLLVVSGLFVLLSALGFLFLKDFFMRMHPPALAYSFGSWCVSLAGILYLSALDATARLQPWLVIILLGVTVPVTTVLLARAALFRHRQALSPDVPPPLTRRVARPGRAP